MLVLIEGGGVQIAGLAALVAVVESTGAPSATLLALVLTIFSYGQGLVMAPLSSAVLATVKPVSVGAGAGSGMSGTTAQIANAAAVAAIGTVFFAVESAQLAGWPCWPHPRCLRCRIIACAAFLTWMRHASVTN